MCHTHLREHLRALGLESNLKLEILRVKVENKLQVLSIQPVPSTGTPGSGWTEQFIPEVVEATTLVVLWLATLATLEATLHKASIINHSV